ncbi:glycerophosphodiester phosphodiesterase [Sorangium cellulosum]|uniref:glycerophosphodiester phosphodiesterase n=1 Tax=Sorangium cellulosum TaxID=56 RepID=A0A150SZV6_SORCE|nr:glycerophosphodiester phosphodiesterase [Sorangium cellulosum]KYG00634.1 glycerophosphodiester phosphodiesterase [Sorangium cellulosum]
MIKKSARIGTALALIALPVVATSACSGDESLQPASRPESPSEEVASQGVQLGPRPYYLVEDMDDGELKEQLMACSEGPFQRTDFSIGHRGACMQFPEHTRESYEAAARMGAGIVECDVTFTKDRQLVCRHAQCDLHTTTNILAIPELAEKCSEPFVPADAAAGTPASAKCCTSDITLAELRQLCGKMDSANPDAATVEEYMASTPDFRTDLYATCGTLLTHAESIELFSSLGVKFTPELKAPEVEMPYEGDYEQRDYAQQMIDEYKAAGVDPESVFAQSFSLDDVLYWLEEEPEFGAQAVYLDSRVDTAEGYEGAVSGMESLAAQGVKIVAPPLFALVTLDGKGQIVPSEYAEAAKAAGLDIITWTLERSGPLAIGGDYYYQSVADGIDNDGDTMVMLDVLARDVGVRGVFSDWPATVTYYANCMGL